MKKIFIVSTAVFTIFSFAVSTFAAPVGNIARSSILKSSEDTGDIDFKAMLEIEIDITFDRNIKNQEDETEFNFYGTKLGVIFKDNLVLYGLLGVSDLEQSFKDNGSILKITTETDFAWGLGATAILYEHEYKSSIFRLGIDGRYRSSTFKADDITLDNVNYDSKSPAVSSVDIGFDEWQVALAASLEWDMISPYIGVKYSDIDGKLETTISGTRYRNSSLESDDNIGVFVGMDAMFSDSLAFNIEGRFLDEEAVSIGLSKKF